MVTQRELSGNNAFCTDLAAFLRPPGLQGGKLRHYSDAQRHPLLTLRVTWRH